MESIVFLGQEPKKTPCPRFQIQILLNKKFKPLSSQCCWMSISQSLSTTKEGEERLLATGGWSRTGLVAPVLHLCLCWHHFSLLATVLLAVILAAAPLLSLCPFLQPEPLGLGVNLLPLREWALGRYVPVFSCLNKLSFFQKKSHCSQDLYHVLSISYR